MSELKAFNCVDSDLQEFCEPRLVYLKSEADKVIAELKAQKAQTEDDCDFWKTMAQKNAEDNAVMAKQRAEAFERSHHHKYKRCLAMRNMCRYAQYSYSYLMENEGCKIRPNNIDFRRYNKKYHFYIRWRKRWMKLAEQFKEAK